MADKKERESPPEPPFEPTTSTQLKPPNSLRAWESYSDTGVHRLTGAIPNGEGMRDVTAIRFPEDGVPCREEKDLMEQNGVKYDTASRIWAASNTPANRDMTRNLAKRIVEERRTRGKGAER